MYRSLLLFFVISFMWLPILSATTVLLLKDGGTLEGELLNPDEVNRKWYKVQTAEGLEISLDARLVERVQSRERTALMEYNRDAPLTENTLETHLLWAKWCHERQLFDQSKLHWQQVLEFEPDHGDARRILGYTETPGGWESLSKTHESRGLILDRGRWRTKYEIEVANFLERQTQTEQQWRRTVSELCRRLPMPQAEAELLAIRDPAAIVPIAELLQRGSLYPHARLVLLRTLMQIPDVKALRIAVEWTTRPEVPEEIRKTCIEELVRRAGTQPEIRAIMTAVYRGALLSKEIDEGTVRLTAEALANIGGREAVPELIEVLYLTVTQTIMPEQQQGYSFGGGSTGFSAGGRPIRNTVQVPNQPALTALRQLTGVDFGFDQAAWRNWYREAYRSPVMNLRRH